MQSGLRMPISALPEGTVRQLGSTLVITSPVVLLKEFLDNAIDSGATFVDVLVSLNTIDRIEVRDNGHGIHQGDFDSLGRPGHTSKLRLFEELGMLGGKTLGFRGAALASANTLADVSLTTRETTEHVATAITLAKGGGISSQRHASSPVGTTVCATGLFSNLPIRRQVSIKEAPKSLARMKELLQAYALARPWIRLRFTVLKTPNLSWSYVPAATGGVKEAAMQLFGTELASQCFFSISSGKDHRAGRSNAWSSINTPSEEETNPVFEALLPRRTADLRKLGKGAFISVDSRPLSSSRGTAKKLYAIFKECIGDHSSPTRSSDLPRNPFIRLNVRCPSGYYDVNIETSKDDVVFTEEHYVFDRFRSFLSAVYSAPGDWAPVDLPLEVTPAAEAEAPSGAPPQVSKPTQAMGSSWRFDMSTMLDGLSDDENDTENPLRRANQERTNEHTPMNSEASIDKDDDRRQSKEGLHPWSIAKMASQHQRREPLPGASVQERHRETKSRPRNTAVAMSGENPSRSRQQGCVAGRLDRRILQPSSLGDTEQDIFEHIHHQKSTDFPTQSRYLNGPRVNWKLRSPPSSSPHEYNFNEVFLGEHPQSQFPGASAGPVQARISFDRDNRGQRCPNTAGPDIQRQSHTFSMLSKSAGASTITHLPDAHVVEDVIVDTFALGSILGGNFLQGPGHRESTLHDANAVEADEGVHHKDGQNGMTPRHSLSVQDPRLQLIRQQRLMAGGWQKKPRRLRTEQLPLETIPWGAETFTLLLTITVHSSGLAQQLRVASRYDAYLVDGELRGGFGDGISPEDAAGLVKSLHEHTGQ